MPIPTVLQKLDAAAPGSFHVLEPEKAARFNARTMYIPSPEDVARAIAAIPVGETRTISEIRKDLALLGNAETACPGVTNKYWKWLAQANDEEPGLSPKYVIPWWRVLKDGKPSPHMPGGVERQVALLRGEGVQIESLSSLVG